MQVSAIFESLFLHLSLEQRGGGQGRSVKNKQTLGWQQWKMREKKKTVLMLFWFHLFSQFTYQIKQNMVY